MRRLFLAAVTAVGIHALLLAMKPSWQGKMPEGRINEPLSIELQMLPPPESREKVPEPIDIPAELPKEESPDYAPADEHLPGPLPEPAPVLEPEPEAEPKPAPVLEPEPESVPVPPREPVRVPDAEPSPEPKNRVQSDKIPEKPVKSAPEPVEKPENNDVQTSGPSESRKSEEPAGSPSAQTRQPASPPPPAPLIKEARPEYLKNDPPEYPRLARRRGYSGTAVIEVLVSRDGRPEEVKLLSSSGHRLLDESALSAVADWRFQPGTRNGIPVSMRVKFPVRFSLE